MGSAEDRTRQHLAQQAQDRLRAQRQRAVDEQSRREQLRDELTHEVRAVIALLAREGVPGDNLFEVRAKGLRGRLGGKQDLAGWHLSSDTHESAGGISVRYITLLSNGTVTGFDLLYPSVTSRRDSSRGYVPIDELTTSEMNLVLGPLRKLRRKYE